jgi:hypothetical protein
VEGFNSGVKGLNKGREVMITISLLISITILVVTTTTPVAPPLEVKLHFVYC